MCKKNIFTAIGSVKPKIIYRLLNIYFSHITQSVLCIENDCIYIMRVQYKSHIICENIRNIARTLSCNARPKITLLVTK